MLRGGRADVKQGEWRDGIARETKLEFGVLVVELGELWLDRVPVEGQAVVTWWRGISSLAHTTHISIRTADMSISRLSTGSELHTKWGVSRC